MSCVPGYVEEINTHHVGSLTIPRASIKWVYLWELLAYILNMHSYSNAYINRLGLAGLVTGLDGHADALDCMAPCPLCSCCRLCGWNSGVVACAVCSVTCH